jgi:hypothetical protein
MTSKPKFRVVCLCGGESLVASPMATAFDTALIRFLKENAKLLKENLDLVITNLSMKMIRENNWSIDHVFEQLMNCDFHFIYCHPGQGLTEWYVVKIHQSIFFLFLNTPPIIL